MSDGKRHNYLKNQPEQRARANTDVKPSFAVTSVLARTPALRVREMTLNDIAHNFWTIETSTFLHHFLSWENADADVCSVLSALNSSSPKWFSLPEDPKLEKDLYAPFVNAANAVLDTCTTVDPKVELALDSIFWQASPNKNPRSPDQWSPQICPDLLAAIGLKNALEEHRKLDEQIEDLEQRLDLEAETEAEREKLRLEVRLFFDPYTPLFCLIALSQRKEVLKKCELWWLRVHLPVEVKLGDSEEVVLEGLVQLSTYMRMVLAEQLDRRFAIGLLLCKEKLTVWLCDRSGLVGTRTAIDIRAVRFCFIFFVLTHSNGIFLPLCFVQEPKKFIQIIIALSCLDPSRLGWDTTMRIYRIKTGTYHFSTDKDVTVSDYGNSPHQTTWAITGPKSDGTEGEDEYLTVKALSTVRAQVMDGRATIVWLVVNKRTMEVRFLIIRVD